MNRESILKLAFALFIVGIATYARVQLESTLQNRMPFGTYTLAVILVAWVCGAWPAVLALVTSTVCAAHFIIIPEKSLAIADPGDQIALAIFFTVGIVSILLFDNVEYQRKRAVDQAEENQKLNVELLKLDKRKDQFLSLLAHELRSPLAPIGNSIELLRKSQQLCEDVRPTVVTLTKNFRHLVRLVNDLLDVSRFLRDSIELRHENTDLVECITTAVDMNCDDILAKQHQLTLDLPEQPIYVVADQVRMCQVFCNLISNATRYTPECGEIHLELKANEHWIVASVQDNGLGIDDSIKQQIFTPFFQANGKQSRFAPGLGLGLCIVKKLVELHGGKVEVWSRGANTGSRFSIKLPISLLIKPQQSTPLPQTGESRVTPTAASRSTSNQHLSANAGQRGANVAADRETRNGNTAARQLRVLIADDDCDTSETLSRLLQLEGFSTQVAHSGLAATHQYKLFQPDFLVLDIGLPELSGFEVAECIRSEPHRPQARIIAVSGWGAEADRKRGIQAGFDAHLLKPVNLDELLSLLTLDATSRGDPSRNTTIRN